MSRRFGTKRGKSVYIERLNPSAKRFLNTCVLCQSVGYDPAILDEGFVHPSVNKTDYEHSAIFAALTEAYKPLKLDECGRCEECRRAMERSEI